MKKTIPGLTLVFLAAGILVFCGSSLSVPAISPEAGIDRSIHDLKARVTNLEVKIADLQKQLKSLEGKFPRVLTIPDPAYFPRQRIPPGAKQHEVGGIKYWTIPLDSGQ